MLLDAVGMRTMPICRDWSFDAVLQRYELHVPNTPTMIIEAAFG